ncbi:hypothetical protein AOLI_G00043570 [Acnodon oligacanthus]
MCSEMCPLKVLKPHAIIAKSRVEAIGRVFVVKCERDPSDEVQQTCNQGEQSAENAKDPREIFTKIYCMCWCKSTKWIYVSTKTSEIMLTS